MAGLNSLFADAHDHVVRDNAILYARITPEPAKLEMDPGWIETERRPSGLVDPRTGMAIEDYIAQRGDGMAEALIHIMRTNPEFASERMPDMLEALRNDGLN